MVITQQAQVDQVDVSSIPFTRYDVGWVILCIGMAIGSGIVFLPVQVGIKGLWVFILSVIIAYPGVYFLQSLYLKTLSESPECDDYTSVITSYLGPNWGVGLSIAYFLMLLKGMLTYSLAITFDSASYLHTFGISQTLLSDYFWYGLVVLVIMVSIAAQGEKLLFKVAGPMVLFKLGIVVMLGVVMVPHWNMNNIPSFPALVPLMRDTLLTLPFTLFSILFVQILSPMNVAYRKVEPNRLIANYKAVRAHRIAFAILVVSVLFFAFSFSLVLGHEEAVHAFEQNISALAMATKVIPGAVVRIMTTLLNIFAIMTAFFGIFLGFQEAIKGIAYNLISRIIPKERIHTGILNVGVCVFVVLILWAWVMTRFSIIVLTQIASPVFGIVACLIPCYLVLKVPVLHKFKGAVVYYVIILGIMLCVTPIIRMFE